MLMERRVLIAIFLSFIVLYVYQAFVVKPAPKTPLPPSATASSSNAAAAPRETVKSSSDVPAPQTDQPVSATVVGDGDERDVKIENRDVIAVFTNRGARLKSWRL